MTITTGPVLDERILLTVSWEALSQPNSSTIKEYELKINELIFQYPERVTSADIHVDPFQTYYFMIRAITGSGFGNWSTQYILETLPETTLWPTTTVESTATVAPTTTTTISITAYTPRESSSFITLENLNEQFGQVSQIAWEDSQLILKNNNTPLNTTVELKIEVGPTTDLYFNDNEAALNTAISFWKHFDNPTLYIALFYNFADISWAEDKLRSYGDDESFVTIRSRGPCTDSICSGATSGIGIGPYTSVGVGVFGISQSDSRNQYRYGPIQIHEYTHAVQAAPWISNYNPREGQSTTSPCWLTEGNAHFVGLSAGITDYEDYLELRGEQVRGRHWEEQFNDYSTPRILEYYNNSVPFECIMNSDYVLGYSIGFLTVEALSSIAGSDSSMYLYKFMGSGMTFEEAFQIVYNSSWDEAKPVLASFVSSVIGELFNP